MKKFRFLLTTMMLAMICAGFVSCSDDDDDTPTDLATLVSGSYGGTVNMKWANPSYGEKGYVTLTRLSSDVVRASISSDGWGLNDITTNLTVRENNGLVTLKSETNYSIEGTYYKGQLDLNFILNVNGSSYDMVFSGTKN